MQLISQPFLQTLNKTHATCAWDEKDKEEHRVVDYAERHKGEVLELHNALR